MKRTIIPSLRRPLIVAVVVGIAGAAWARPQQCPPAALEVQGHRGFRGAWPENTWAGMKAALDAGVHTLEMDVVLTRDGQVVLSHEPWINPEICAGTDGRSLRPSNGRTANADQSESASDYRLQHNIYTMDYALVRRYPCGSPEGHPRFSKQRSIPACKPLLSEVFDSVQKYVRETGTSLPCWNIEIKSKPEWDGVFTPGPDSMVARVVRVLQASGLKESCVVQSFDPRVLRALAAEDGSVARCLLLEYGRTLFPTRVALKALNQLGVEVKVFSPNYRLVSPRMLRRLHAQGLRVVPWTVNNALDMRRLHRMGVDGLITDYPDILTGYLRPIKD